MAFFCCNAYAAITETCVLALASSYKCMRGADASVYKRIEVDIQLPPRVAAENLYSVLTTESLMIVFSDKSL